WAAPHSSIWIASASANTSRPQPCALDIGVRKNPNPERAPKPIIAIRQPQARMTAGERQDAGGRTPEERRDRAPPPSHPPPAVRRALLHPGAVRRRAGMGAARPTGFSTLGRLIPGESTPNRPESHHTAS